MRYTYMLAGVSLTGLLFRGAASVSEKQIRICSVNAVQGLFS
ncbi:MAG: hypothetical protein Q7U40_02870 [Desulfatirhabdiaceae bacterium]|nr:hypothetical protein [Desulfatirhabdiaceae bacterium]